MKVLVVEDNPDQLAVRTMLIESSGFEVLGAVDRKSAMESAGLGRPVCAVVDLRLPKESDGLQLIRELKHGDPAIRLIVLTGADPARFKRRPEAELVEVVMRKPASSGELIQRLKEFAALPG